MQTDRSRDEITDPIVTLEQFLALSAEHLELEAAWAETPASQDT